MNEIRFDVADETQWRDVAEVLIGRFGNGAVVALRGDLGAGKTTFVRAFVALLSEIAGQEPPRVLSPTFVYRIRYDDLHPPVEHFDLYRLENADDTQLEAIGYAEALEQLEEDQGYLFVEWPEKAVDAKDLALDVELAITTTESGRAAVLRSPTPLREPKPQLH